MSKKPLPLDRFDALPDTQKDACAAVAMGWEFNPESEVVSAYWFRRRDDGRIDLAPLDGPPPYFTGAPGAPGRDRWNGEMLRALRKEFAGEVVTVMFFPSGRVSVGVSSARFAAVTQELVGGECDGTVKGDTLADALVRALCAAGKLSDPSDQKE